MKTSTLYRNDTQQQVEKFNRDYQVGHLGFLHKDDGTVVATTVSAPAQELGGRAVAWFEGVRGCYLIDRFVPLR